MRYSEEDWFFLKRYLEYCKHLSWSPTATHSVRKMLCINLRTTDVMDAYEQVFYTLPPADLYANPKILPEINRWLQDSNMWIYLLEHFLFLNDVSTSNGFNKQENMLKQFSVLLEESQIFLNSWRETLILYLLVNISCVPSANVCKVYVSKVLKKDKTAQCTLFLQKFADMRQTREEYIDTFRFLLNECFTENDAKKVEMYNESIKKMQRSTEFWEQKTMQACKGRLRLRDRLAQTRKDAETIVRAYETFDAFQENLSFSSNVSYSSKLAFYFLACQLNAPIKEIMKNVKMRHVKSESVSKLKVIQMPDTDKIQEFIAKIRYVGAPDPLMTEFHGICLRSLSLTVRNTLSLSTIMQLYVCIYQNEVSCVLLYLYCKAFHNSCMCAGDMERLLDKRTSCNEHAGHTRYREFSKNTPCSRHGVANARILGRHRVAYTKMSTKTSNSTRVSCADDSFSPPPSR